MGNLLSCANSKQPEKQGSHGSVPSVDAPKKQEEHKQAKSRQDRIQNHKEV